MNSSLRSRALAVLAAFVAALALSLSAGAPASGDANEGAPGTLRNDAATIAAGGSHTCALVSGGTVWCWGSNVLGQLGNGTTQSSNRPVQVSGISGAIGITAGLSHTCALLQNRTARCWGHGSLGQLGNGSFATSQVPVQVSGLSNLEAISAGAHHTCASTLGSIFCWGLNDHGQLGNGSFANSSSPTAVVGGIGGATAISGGWGHTCAILTSTNVACWGWNDVGQLANPGASMNTPFPVMANGATGAQLITAGNDHTCVVGGGPLRCWGYNFAGQLGTGFVGGSSSSPVTVVGIGSVNAVAAGGNHTCARELAGQVRCWGQNNSGQLGNGNTVTSASAVGVSGLGSALGVTVGGSHSCALVTDRSVRCWGAGGLGQLGHGSNTSSSLPVTPAISPPGAPTDVVARPDFASATVSFKAPDNTGNLPITGYQVVASPGGITVSGSASPITVTGLANGTTYTFSVQAINGVGGGPAGTSNPVTPSSTPFFEITDTSLVEGNSGSKNATFTVKRFGNVSGVSQVKYATANGTATANGDYLAKALTNLYFSAGQTSKAVAISVKGDLLVEPTETFQVNLSAPVNGTIYDPSGTGTIVNDDSSAPPTFSVNDVAVTEGNSGSVNAVFTITRNGSAAAAASVKYQTINDTAFAPGDYTAKALTSLSFLAGQTTKTVAVAVKGELLGEPDEAFRLVLSAPTGATIVDGTGVGTILNDDSTATTTVSVNDVSITEGDSLTKSLTFTITRSGSLASSSSVKYATADGTAVAPGDYTAKALTTVSFAAGQSVKTVTVTIKGDTVVEPDESFEVVLSAPVGTVIGDGTGVGLILNDD